jgi:histone H3/H4
MSEHLVVASKIKKTIRDKAGMNTSLSAFEALTRIVEEEIQHAIENAKRNNRKTVMDRDFTSSRQY